MRPNRIKETRLAAFTVNGSLLANTYSTAVNGEILKVTMSNVTSPGSFWITESGTDIELWRRNNITSGLSAFSEYPFVYLVNSTNTTGSPQTFDNMVVNGPIYFAGSGFTSGTSKIFGPVTVHYR